MRTASGLHPPENPTGNSDSEGQRQKGTGLTQGHRQSRSTAFTQERKPAGAGDDARKQARAPSEPMGTLPVSHSLARASYVPLQIQSLVKHRNDSCSTWLPTVTTAGRPRRRTALTRLFPCCQHTAGTHSSSPDRQLPSHPSERPTDTHSDFLTPSL